MLTNLSPAAKTALAKLLAEEASESRDLLAVGVHQVQETVTLTVSGKVTVGEDYPQNIVAKADPWTLLAVALSHLNEKTIESITQEALTLDPEMVKSIKKSAEKAIGALKAPTLTECKGKVTTKDLALVLSVAQPEESSITELNSKVA